MWPWDSVAKECEFIASTGVDWVLVSPAQEHIEGGAWWTNYQPVSYQIQSRLGSREQFQNMVSTCAGFGVDVIVDVVINHMSASYSGVGVAGTSYNKYEYPGLYTQEDFHDCQLTFDNSIQSYADQAQVQTCELLGLSDLNTSLPSVQEKILGLLNDLLSLGVKGFRIDAAKHISPDDLKPIVAALPEGTVVLLEVIRGPGEPIQPEQYLELGSVWEFDYAKNMKAFFVDQAIGYVDSEARYISHAPSEKAISFVSNHDTERNGQAINFGQSRYFELATAMMLAEDYGTPMLYSSYAFVDYDGAPRETDGLVDAIDCSSTNAPKEFYDDREWICQHRWETTVKMIDFRNRVHGAPVVEIYQSETVYGFAREGKGYFITNVSLDAAADIDVVTTLSDGSYEDLFSGESFEIKDGKLKASIGPSSAIVLLAKN
jgi:alpha-amylase